MKMNCLRVWHERGVTNELSYKCQMIHSVAARARELRSVDDVNSFYLFEETPLFMPIKYDCAIFCEHKMLLVI